MTLKGIIKDLQKKINQQKKKLERSEGRIKKVIDLWRREYNAYNIRVARISHRIQKGLRMNTKEVIRMAELNAKWPKRSKEITAKRDIARDENEKIKKQLEKLKVELATVMERDRMEQSTTDNVVNQIFLFRDSIVNALEEMNAFLNENVYDKLIGTDGKLRSQLTIDSSDGTRRVVAMVNSISKVDPNLAAEALLQINVFFERIVPKEREMDDATVALYELTQKILVEKTSFKVGPDLYRFLSLDLNNEVFPELVKAQRLLKRSLRSEKTNRYIKLYERKTRNDKFMPVKLAA